MVSERMHESIAKCWQTRAYCQEIFFNHCLEKGGKHVAPKHVRLMVDCIQICQIAVDLMTRDSSSHVKVCKTCAEVCRACAKSCEEIGDEEMKKCAEICLSCADACERV